MRSKRAIEAFRCSALVVAAAVLGWGCPPQVQLKADSNAFQRSYKGMRTALSAQTGSSGVQIDDNAIVLGAVSTANGSTPNLTRMPSEMHVTQGNTPALTWVCWDCKSFKLTFKPDPNVPNQQSPLDTDPIQGVAATPPATATATVKGSAPKGRYKFQIDAVLNDGTPVSDPDCPPIIIQ